METADGYHFSWRCGIDEGNSVEKDRTGKRGAEHMERLGIEARRGILSGGRSRIREEIKQWIERLMTLKL